MSKKVCTRKGRQGLCRKGIVKSGPCAGKCKVRGKGHKFRVTDSETGETFYASAATAPNKMHKAALKALINSGTKLRKGSDDKCKIVFFRKKGGSLKAIQRCEGRKLRGRPRAEVNAQRCNAKGRFVKSGGQPCGRVWGNKRNMAYARKHDGRK